MPDEDVADDGDVEKADEHILEFRRSSGKVVLRLELHPVVKQAGNEQLGAAEFAPSYNFV